MTDVMTEQDVDFVPAAEDAAALEAATQAMADEVSAPVLEDPTDGPIRLPGGFRRMVPGSSPPKFVYDTKVTIKELDGFGEERIAKARQSNELTDFLDAILESGLVKIGSDVQPTLDNIKNLLSGDRDHILLQISRATYGDEIVFENQVCPHCLEMFDVTIDKSEEIPVSWLDKPEDSDFTFTTKKGRELHVHLPSVEDQDRAFDGGTGPEGNSILLGYVVEEFRADPDEARALSVADRAALVKELAERNPGPRYNVTIPHEPGCGQEVGLPVTLAHLFPGM